MYNSSEMFTNNFKQNRTNFNRTCTFVLNPIKINKLLHFLIVVNLEVSLCLKINNSSNDKRIIQHKLYLVQASLSDSFPLLVL